MTSFLMDPKTHTRANSLVFFGQRLTTKVTSVRSEAIETFGTWMTTLGGFACSGHSILCREFPEKLFTAACDAIKRSDGGE